MKLRQDYVFLFGCTVWMVVNVEYAMKEEIAFGITWWNGVAWMNRVDLLE